MPAGLSQTAPVTPILMCQSTNSWSVSVYLSTSSAGCAAVPGQDWAEGAGLCEDGMDLTWLVEQQQPAEQLLSQLCCRDRCPPAGVLSRHTLVSAVCLTKGCEHPHRQVRGTWDISNSSYCSQCKYEVWSVHTVTLTMTYRACCGAAQREDKQKQLETKLWQKLGNPLWWNSGGLLVKCWTPCGIFPKSC